jgi:hypothetical protein
LKFAKKLARVVLAIVITVAIASTASARGMSHEVVEPAALEAGPVYRTPSLEMHQPLQVEILGRAPTIDFGFHPSDAAHKSIIRNVFPVQPGDAYFERAPNIDMGIFPPGDASRTRSHELAQPLQVEILGKNPTEAVKQPQQCDVCTKNPTEAVKQPQQCDVCTKNPTEAVKQPPQCDDVCEKTPYQAVRGPLDIECCGPTMRFSMKEDASAEIAIYNVNGRLVRRLTAVLSSGESTITWDGNGDRGGRAASGVYFARVQANEQTGKGKLVVVR